jgi:hypothetical protein
LASRQKKNAPQSPSVSRRRSGAKSSRIEARDLTVSTTAFEPVKVRTVMFD